MASDLHSTSKMLFYPTDPIETYRMIGVVCNLQFVDYYSFRNNHHLIEAVGGSLVMSRLISNALDNDVSPVYSVYEHFLISGQYEKIPEFIKIEYPGLYEGKKTNIVDLFAGEGDWLKVWTGFIPSEHRNRITLIANEIEEGRFEKAKKQTDLCYNTSFEELQLPKRFVGMMLFNPPYHSSNNERNARRYLRMILEREYLKEKNHQAYNSDYGSPIIMVLRKDDVEDCLDLICRFFDVRGMYKVNPNEFEKYSQIVVYATAKTPTDTSNAYETGKYQESFRQWKNWLTFPKNFTLKQYEEISRYYINFPNVDLKSIFENFKYVQKKEKYVSSSKSLAWKWLKEKVDIEDNGVKKLTMPRQPKSSELANIIASGYINAEMNEEGTPRHIAIGGVKTVIKTDEKEYNDDEGNVVTESKVTKQSLPYLNVLYADQQGIIKIKELSHE